MIRTLATQPAENQKFKQKIGSATEQHREFVKAARELGTDESEDAFDKVLRKVASAPPPATVRQRKVDIERRKHRKGEIKARKK